MPMALTTTRTPRTSAGVSPLGAAVGAAPTVGATTGSGVLGGGALGSGHVGVGQLGEGALGDGHDGDAALGGGAVGIGTARGCSHSSISRSASHTPTMVSASIVNAKTRSIPAMPATTGTARDRPGVTIVIGVPAASVGAPAIGVTIPGRPLGELGSTTPGM